MATVALEPERVPLQGFRGPMYIGTLVRLFYRNGVRGTRAQFLRNRWGARNGAPHGCCTLVIESKLPFEEDEKQRVNRKGVLHNVPAPWVPELTLVRNPDGLEDGDDEIVARGWRWLLKKWIERGLLRQSEELLAVLGPQDFQIAVSRYRVRLNSPRPSKTPRRDGPPSLRERPTPTKWTYGGTRLIASQMQRSSTPGGGIIGGTQFRGHPSTGTP